MLHSQMAGSGDNNNAFDFVLSKMRRGTEPPPHVHSREDEFIYVLSGAITVFVDGEVFPVKAGECVFLPRRKPHGWVIMSAEIQVILLVTPGGFYDAFNTMSVPAERMELPSEVDSVSYAKIDLTETIKVSAEYGTRFLTPDELETEMPEFARTRLLAQTLVR